MESRFIKMATTVHLAKSDIEKVVKKNCDINVGVIWLNGDIYTDKIFPYLYQAFFELPENIDEMFQNRVSVYDGSYWEDSDYDDIYFDGSRSDKKSTLISNQIDVLLNDGAVFSNIQTLYLLSRMLGTNIAANLVVGHWLVTESGLLMKGKDWTPNDYVRESIENR